MRGPAKMGGPGGGRCALADVHSETALGGSMPHLLGRLSSAAADLARDDVPSDAPSEAKIGGFLGGSFSKELQTNLYSVVSGSLG